MAVDIDCEDPPDSLPTGRSIAGYQRACYQRALTDDRFAERELRVRSELRSSFCRLFEDRYAEIDNPNPERAVEFCAELYVSVVTDHIIGEAFSVSGLTDTELADELLDACCAYLRI